MAIIKKATKCDKQLNIKITVQVHARYEAVKKACLAKSWVFTLQPDFESWLNTQLDGAEKELAAHDKTLAKQATETGVGA
ncbi:MAG: hypothetical protein RDU24_08225 [Humidesulfovibrio sp.]|jgi:hypothetical protein|uniref:hypothetical protein n=1 Tax=Humidesulfovibrio sp. TaxID=2910988 RepID=UPI0027340E86|nr:hypothetical protein [Humidesulfovibrio sp.]MDP2847662.1 hypothetical protein [Humidesulfovibrio sp.]MDQ7835354.1 hypothetical protein [Humidesulfovibrio sp.]